MSPSSASVSPSPNGDGDVGENENDHENNINNNDSSAAASARGFMGEVLDKISDAMADSLGGWSELLTEVKQMNQILKAQEEERKREQEQQRTSGGGGGMYRSKSVKTDENIKMIANLVTKALSESLQKVLIGSLNKLPASLGRQIIDDTYQNIVTTLEDFLHHAHQDQDDEQE